jgi:hypothetical protein
MIRPRRRRNSVAYALWANAILLGGILIMLVARGGHGPSFTAPAFAEQPPIAGGGGLFVMPGQLGQLTWGCYLMDVDRQTLMVYEYEPGTHKLRMVAGRSIKYDRDVTNLGTYPSPDEIRDWVDRAKNGNRQAPPAGGGAEQPNNGNH